MTHRVPAIGHTAGRATRAGFGLLRFRRSLAFELHAEAPAPDDGIVAELLPHRVQRLVDAVVGRSAAEQVALGGPPRLDQIVGAEADQAEGAAHNNERENDLHGCVVCRNISGGVRSDAGCACRDAFLTHMKACARHGISFRDYLGDSLDIPGADDVH